MLVVSVPVQRCVRHKERNVLAHLPERDRPVVRRRLRTAWSLDDHDRGLDEPPSARRRARPAATPVPPRRCAKGMEETLTVTRLGVGGRPKRTPASTNPCETKIETVRRISRNAMRWHKATCACAGQPPALLEPQAQFRRFIGHGDLAKLAFALSATSPPSAPRALHRARQAPIATAAPEVAASPA